MKCVQNVKICKRKNVSEIIIFKQLDYYAFRRKDKKLKKNHTVQFANTATLDCRLDSEPALNYFTNTLFKTRIRLNFISVRLFIRSSIRDDSQLQNDNALVQFKII